LEWKVEPVRIKMSLSRSKIEDSFIHESSKVFSVPQFSKETIASQSAVTKSTVSLLGRNLELSLKENKILPELTRFKLIDDVVIIHIYDNAERSIGQYSVFFTSISDFCWLRIYIFP
jgi:hypothetical protein